MGVKDYFKPHQAQPPPAALAPPMMSEKTAPYTASITRSGSVDSSSRSTHSSTYIDEIKHEVMVNYLYQQQCSHLWVDDPTSHLEGVMLRKSRNNYLACPPQLADSPFGLACAALNCQVSIFGHSGWFRH